MLKLWCAGKLCNTIHLEKIDRFRFTCLSCRIRRRLAGKYIDPPYWIDYTYKSSIVEHQVDGCIQYGKECTVKANGKINVMDFTTLRIDPRGHFTAFRCAAIMIFDGIMSVFGFRKPFTEFCEFLANFPV